MRIKITNTKTSISGGLRWLRTTTRTCGQQHMFEGHTISSGTDGIWACCGDVDSGQNPQALGPFLSSWPLLDAGAGGGQATRSVCSTEDDSWSQCELVLGDHRLIPWRDFEVLCVCVLVFPSFLGIVR